MAKNNTLATKILLLDGPAGAAASDAINREAYLYNTVYIENPTGVAVTVYSSLNGDDPVGTAHSWVQEATYSTSIRIQVPGKVGWIGVTCAAAAVGLRVWLLSGGRETR